MDKGGVILVLLFFVCALLAYVVDDLLHRKAEKNKERKAETDRLLFINSIRTCKSRTEIYDILFSGITLSVPNDTIATELIDAMKRINAEKSRKEESRNNAETGSKSENG